MDEALELCIAPKRGMAQWKVGLHPDGLHVRVLMRNLYLITEYDLESEWYHEQWKEAFFCTSMPHGLPLNSYIHG
jgi:hypothetical protein